MILTPCDASIKAKVPNTAQAEYLNKGKFSIEVQKFEGFQAL